MGTEPETEQGKKFKETARELGVDLDEEKLKEALRKIAKPVNPKENDDA